MDFANEYRLALERGDASKLGPAIAGLSEVGQESDARFVVPHLSHGRSHVRQALRAVCSLLKKQSSPHVLRALASELAGVSKTAAALLRGRELVVTATELVPLLRSPLPHIRVNTLAVLAAKDRWEALIGALEHLSDADARVVAVARSIVDGWRYFPPTLYSRPNAAQRVRLGAALRAARAAATNVSPLVHTIAENG